MMGTENVPESLTTFSQHYLGQYSNANIILDNTATPTLSWAIQQQHYLERYSNANIILSNAAT
jgi:hypothetical protein